MGILSTLKKYGQVERLVEENIAPPLEYWRVSVYDEFHARVYSLARELSRTFDTYMFRACQTSEGIFIYIYKKL